MNVKEYLKMADVFGGAEVGIRKGAPSLVDCCGVLAANCLCPETAEHIAHAINSHDELVRMNRELLDALNEVASSLSWLAHGECMGFVDGPILTSSEAINKARLAITKANGGAA